PSVIIRRLKSSSQQLWPYAASFLRALPVGLVCADRVSGICNLPSRIGNGQTASSFLPPQQPDPMCGGWAASLLCTLPLDGSEYPPSGRHSSATRLNAVSICNNRRLLAKPVTPLRPFKSGKCHETGPASST